MNPSINVNYVDLNDLIVCAFRYALGRRTYITHTISDIASKYVKSISYNHLTVMIRDINRAFETNDYGMDMDKKEWEKLLAILNEEIANRKPNSG